LTPCAIIAFAEGEIKNMKKGSKGTGSLGGFFGGGGAQGLCYKNNFIIFSFMTEDAVDKNHGLRLS
jgi:hypothetical protein